MKVLFTTLMTISLMAMGTVVFGQVQRPKMIPVQFLPADADAVAIENAIATCEALVGPERLAVGPICEAFKTVGGDIQVRPTAEQRDRL